MKFLCPSCKAKYQIADEKVSGRTLKMVCRQCGEEIVIRGDGMRRTQSSVRPEAEPRASERPSVAPAGLESELWHVAIDDQPVGPMPRDEVGRKMAMGALDEDSLAWRDGFQDWLPIREVPELMVLWQAVHSGSAAHQQAVGMASGRPTALAGGQALAGSGAADAVVARAGRRSEQPVRRSTQSEAPAERRRTGDKSSRRASGAAERHSGAARSSDVGQTSSQLSAARSTDNEMEAVPSHGTAASMAPQQAAADQVAERPASRPSWAPPVELDALERESGVPEETVSSPPDGAADDWEAEDADGARGSIESIAPVSAESSSDGRASQTELRSESPGSAAIVGADAVGDEQAAGPAVVRERDSSPDSTGPEAPARKVRWQPIFLLVSGGAFILAIGAVLGVQLFAPASRSTDAAGVQQQTQSTGAEAPVEAPGAALELELPEDLAEDAGRRIVLEPEDIAAAPVKGETRRVARNRRGGDAPEAKEDGLTDEEREMLARMGGGFRDPSGLKRSSSASGSGASARQGLEASQLAAVVNKGKRSLQRCYENALRGAGSSETVRLDVEITVSSNGNVTRVKTKGRSLPGMEKCISSTARTWRFPESSGTTTTQFPILFQPGG